ELVLDERPDDARHLVAVELDDRVLHRDLGHAGSVAPWKAGWGSEVVSVRLPGRPAGGRLERRSAARPAPPRDADPTAGPPRATSAAAAEQPLDALPEHLQEQRPALERLGRGRCRG